jgi:sortase A
LGNSAIAGHRTTHGAPFGKINDLEAGDDIIVTTLAGQYIYVVTGKTIVDPSDYSLVIPTNDATKATLTLTSCHPAYSTRQRLVVFAQLDIARSSPVTLPATDLGEQDPSTLPGESLPGESLPVETAPIETAVETAVGSSGTATTETASTETATTEQATTETATTETASTEPAVVAQLDPPDDSADVFANRWFADSSAFPQVALWGLLLILVAFGSYAISRRARRNWVGLLVGIVPFIVVLYYWFENVNRLLPPNL